MGSTGSCAPHIGPPGPLAQTIGVLECSEQGGGGAVRPPCLAPEPLRRLNPSSHEPGGPQGLVSGQDTGRTGRGRAAQCFAVWAGARDVPGAGKHTDKQLFLGCKSRHCPKNHQPEPLPSPGANFPCADGRTLWDTPASAPVHPQNH